jgi:hypothetical protein
MSEKNGDKARFQKNRKRSVLRRAKARELAVTGVGAGAGKQPSHAKAQPAKS